MEMNNMIPWNKERVVWDPIEDMLKMMSLPLTSEPTLLHWVGPEKAAWVPKVDLEESEEAFVLSASLPGMKKEDIRVEVEDDVVTLHGERKFKTEEEAKGFRKVEQTYGSFHRTLQLPGPVAADGVEAVYKDGILEIRLPKTEGSKTRVVDVQ